MASVTGGGGGGGSVTLLDAVTLSADGTFDVQNISQGYNDLLLSLVVRGTAATALDGLMLRFNNDSTSGNYISQSARSNGSTVSGSASTASQTSGSIAGIAAGSAPTGYFAQVAVTIPGYSSTTWQKIALGQSGAAGSATSPNVWIHAFQWLSTAAITRVALFGGSTANLLAGSTLRIYGRL